MNPRHHVRRRYGAFCSAAAVCALAAGCAPTGTVPPAAVDAPATVRREVPPPDSPWRPYVLLECAALEEGRPSRIESRALDTAWDLFQAGEGADAIAELEFHLEEHPRPGGLALLTLAQLYVLAGQGEPGLVPREGPAADTGDWKRNKSRFLKRAEELIERCRPSRPDDAVLDYLLGDSLRARGDFAAAEESVAAARRKCSFTASFDLLRRYQGLGKVSPQQITPAAPKWPSGVTRGGEVELDLLISPDGRVHQIDVVKRPGRLLGDAAVAAYRDVRFKPARVGKYEIWAWQRTSVLFR
jgi:TonB family protein